MRAGFWRIIPKGSTRSDIFILIPKFSKILYGSQLTRGFFVSVESKIFANME